MIPPFDLHIHTTFCDGKNTPAEMVEEAIRRGMRTIGFTSHAPLPLEEKWFMTEETLPLYHAEIDRLKREYAGKIAIFKGIERDYYSPPDPYTYDYVIGSVHCVETRDGLFSVDESPESFAHLCKTYFGGDYMWLCHAYFDNVKNIVEKTGCQVVGHFDLVSKFNYRNAFFDEHDPRYVLKALRTLDALIAKDVIFEVNTGAISRGYRISPYPPSWMLQYMWRKGARVTLTSDAHSKENLQFMFELHADKLCRLGYSTCQVIGKNGWRPVPIYRGDERH